MHSISIFNNVASIGGQEITIILSASAALFAYLSWRKAVLTDVYKREDQLRSRLSDPGIAFETNYFTVNAFRIRVVETEGVSYRIKKYTPIGNVKGRTQLTLYFLRGDGRGIFRSEEYADELTELGLHYVSERVIDANGAENKITITVIIDAIDPNEVENKLTEFRVLLQSFMEQNDPD